MSQREFVVAVPTLSCYDMLQVCLRSVLAGTARPREVCVLDNGGGYVPEDDLLASGVPIRVERPETNLGVAGSWNRLHELYAPADVVYMNDDLVLAPDVLERVLESPYPFASAFPEGDSVWSCFLQRESVWERVGEYDTGFFPAYFEDDDYRYRMKLVGLYPRMITSHAGLIHWKSATGGEAFTLFERNGRRFVAKWGGAPRAEVYTTPWNGLSDPDLTPPPA